MMMPPAEVQDLRDKGDKPWQSEQCLVWGWKQDPDTGARSGRCHCVTAHEKLTAQQASCCPSAVTTKVLLVTGNSLGLSDTSGIPHPPPEVPA